MNIGFLIDDNFMLTPTDIQYLSGILTQICEPSSVEVVLGDMVFDTVAEKERDVDITIIHKNNEGIIYAYKGIEVKDHSSPLDVIHVEQLCAKFEDMPHITHKAIVSGSGYTKAAIKKAISRGIQLFEIIDWFGSTEGFKVKFPEKGIEFKEQRYIWEDNLKIEIVIKDGYEDTSNISKIDKPVFCDSEGTHLMITINDLANRALLAYTQTKDAKVFEENGLSQDICINIFHNDNPFILFNKKIIPIEKAIITGKAKLISIQYPQRIKVLRLYGEEAPIAGCAFAELSNKTLLGVSVDEVNVHVLNIPIDQRNRSRIYKKKLGSNN